MKNKCLLSLLTILALFIPAILMAGFLTRDETGKFQRDNPVDKRATNYQGSESVDADGDGEADFVILVNGGATNTFSRIVTLSVNGPRVRRAYFSEDRSFFTNTPLDFQPQYNYSLSSGFGLKTVFAQFEFTGGKRSKTYSNQITLSMTSNQAAWLASTFSFKINGDASFTTNAQLQIDILAPSQAIAMRISESSISATEWTPYNSNCIFQLSGNPGNPTNKMIWIEFKNADAQTALASNSILFVPWGPFSVTVDNNAPFSTNTNVALSLSRLGAQKISIATDANFNEISDWQNSDEITSYSVAPLGDTNALSRWICFSNTNYGLSTIRSFKIVPAPVKNSRITWESNIFDTTNSTVGFFADGSNSQLVVFSTNHLDPHTNWQSISGKKYFDVYRRGDEDTNWLVAIFSNIYWDTTEYCSNFVRYNLEPTWSNSVGVQFTKIGPTTFTQGNISNQNFLSTISKYHAGSHEVTFFQWTNILHWATNHGYLFDNIGRKGMAGTGSDRQPVTAINWFDCIKWCNALSEYEGRTPVYYLDVAKTAIYRNGTNNISNGNVIWDTNGYRLPTESEWEYLNRAGTVSRYFWGNQSTFPGEETNYVVYWFNHQYSNTQDVGSLRPNPLGFYDVTGNVSEIIWDRFDLYEIENLPKTNFRGLDTGIYRGYRGGNILSNPWTGILLEGFARYSRDPISNSTNVGFRISTSIR